MENFAERLFCDLKNLDFKIEKPEFVKDGGKNGQMSVINGIVTDPAKQFVIFGSKEGEEYKYYFGSSPDGIAGVSFTSAYTELLDAIKTLGTNLKFYSLCVPSKGVMEVKLEQFETVVTRYIKDYYVANDSLIWRWDVLVSAVKL